MYLYFIHFLLFYFIFSFICSHRSGINELPSKTLNLSELRWALTLLSYVWSVGFCWLFLLTKFDSRVCLFSCFSPLPSILQVSPWLLQFDVPPSTFLAPLSPGLLYRSGLCPCGHNFLLKTLNCLHFEFPPLLIEAVYNPADFLTWSGPFRHL